MELEVYLTVLAPVTALLRTALAHGCMVQHLAHFRG